MGVLGTITGDEQRHTRCARDRIGAAEANRGLLKGSPAGQLSELCGGVFYRECSDVEAESSLSLGLVEQTQVTPWLYGDAETYRLNSVHGRAMALAERTPSVRGILERTFSGRS
jgi:hypothetical protein